MKVKGLMRAPLASRPSTDLATAARMMRHGKCGFLAVVGPENEVVGLITEHDVSIAVGSHHLTAADMKVEDVMSSNVPSCREEDPIADAMVSITDSRLRCLVVTDTEGRLRGILSTDALVQAARDSIGGRTGPDVVVETSKGLDRRR